MPWILQEFEDTRKLAEALERLGIQFSWHKVVPFVGDLMPEPAIEDPDDVILFGAYTLWRYARTHELQPGVFKVRPFVHEHAWHPFLLNGADAMFLTLRDVPTRLSEDGCDWFLRPVDDDKSEPGNVKSSDEIIRLAQKVLALEEDEIPLGSLRHDTELMLTAPVNIHTEWRLWVVADDVVTWSMYKSGHRVVYCPEIDADALAFGQKLVPANPGYAAAYVLDICRTADGLRMLETNCINAAGFYAADLQKLVMALERLT